MATFFAIKDPDAKLDYIIDWTNWLIGTDTIVTSTWIVPAAITVLSTSTGTATAGVFLSGGVEGEVYDVTNRIVTAGSRTEDRTIQFTVIQR